VRTAAEGLWGDRAFVRLFTARTLSMLALAFAPVALAFGVLDLPGATATTLSTVIAAEAVTIVVFTLAGGVVADRYPRGRVLQVAEWTAATVNAGIGAMLLTGHAPLWGLVCAAVLAGLGQALVWPAMTGLVPEVVPEDRLQQGNAVIGLGGNMARIAGLVAGGIVVVAVSAGWALVAAGVTFAVSGTLVAGLGGSAPPHSGRSGSSAIWNDLREGWDGFRSRTWLWVCVLQFSLIVMVWQASHLVLGPVVAKAELGGAGAWSKILTAEAVGLILGGLVALRWSPRRPILAVVLLSFFAAPPYLLLGWSAPLAVVMVGSFGLGLAFELLTVIWQTTMQTQIPPESLSRVSSYDALGSLFLGPLGLVLAGPAADHVGPHASLVFCGVVMLLASLGALLVPDLRNLRSTANAGGPVAPLDSPTEVGPSVHVP
jgi:MFS family permease